MTKSAKKHASECLIAFGVNVFGDRWTLLIIRDMILHGKKTFSEFSESEEHIATNILSDRLKRLEEDGIVTRSRDPKNGKSYLYALTEKGLGLTPTILEIARWSGKHIPVNEERAKLLEKIENQNAELVEEIMSRHRANQ